ncbi:MAG: Lrp/AsnC family transcriptional regulator [Candidatus Woesearchaeota archaeon]|nr:Lrp/AsnC family transcriptional regulator [Candidatus Woesearchaeota archaeon]
MERMELSPAEKSAVAHLRVNARMPLTKLGRASKMPVSTLFDYLAGRFSAFITKYTALLNFGRLGFHAWAFITMKVAPEEKDKILEYFEKQKCLNSLYKINNGYDFMAEVVFRTMGELEHFVEELDTLFAIREKNIYYVISDIHREQFWAELPEKMRHQRKVYNPHAFSARHGHPVTHRLRRD